MHTELKRAFNRSAIATVMIVLVVFAACQSENNDTPAAPTPPVEQVLQIAEGAWCITENYYVNGRYDGQWFQHAEFIQDGVNVELRDVDECEYLCGSFTGTLDGLELVLNPGNIVFTFAADGRTLTGTREMSARENHTFEGNVGWNCR